MSTPSETPLPGDGQSPAAEPAETKPVRRRRAVKAPPGETVTAPSDATTTPTQVASGIEAEPPAKAPRRRRAAAPEVGPEPPVQAAQTAQAAADAAAVPAAEPAPRQAEAA